MEMLPVSSGSPVQILHFKSNKCDLCKLVVSISISTFSSFFSGVFGGSAGTCAALGGGSS